MIIVIILSAIIIGCSTGNVVNTEDYFEIDLSEVSEEMTKYSYDAGGTQIRFFAVRGSDGEVRTAFDACDVCGGHQGYTQKGDDVMCNSCGRYFNIDDIGTKNLGGGCWPSYLEHNIEGDVIRIKESELESGAYRFI